ncbi:hypothetical protein BC832DRAFT_220736 [Gaertneriomyces semiglobifer]|nr:hypothetical protein BC832DRAFT_220736 [Gaertneriomyces semiglobifer]
MNDILGFGPEKEELKAIDQHVGDRLHFVSEVREFMRERGDMEAEFARKLEALSKKYSTRLDKLSKERGRRSVSAQTGPSWTVDDAVANVLSPGDAEKTVSSERQKTDTTTEAWHAILKETERMAKCHDMLAELLCRTLPDGLKALVHRKDDARKKVGLAFLFSHIIESVFISLVTVPCIF